MIPRIIRASIISLPYMVSPCVRVKKGTEIITGKVPVPLTVRQVLITFMNALSFPFSVRILTLISCRFGGTSGCTSRLTRERTPTGHAVTQRPHPMHLSASITAVSSSMRMASMGHRPSAQIPHPVHAMLSMRASNPLGAKAWGRSSCVLPRKRVQQQRQQLQMKLARSALLLLV